MKKNKVFTRILLLLGIILVVNYISSKLYFRLDFTGDQKYSLSKATKDILKNVDSPVTITAYFSEGLPAELEIVRGEFRDMLVEYQNRSKNNIVFKFVNPNGKDELEAEAQKAGIRPVLINTSEHDQVKQMRAYLGAVVSMGEKKEIIPFIDPKGSIEYPLTTAIKKISISKKPIIAFLQGHGEPAPWNSGEVYQNLSVLYDIETLKLNDSTPISGNYKTVVIINPTDTIPAKHLKQLDDYLSKNGKPVYRAKYGKI